MYDYLIDNQLASVGIVAVEERKTLGLDQGHQLILLSIEQTKFTKALVHNQVTSNQRLL